MKRKTVTVCLLSLCLATAAPGRVYAADIQEVSLITSLQAEPAHTLSIPIPQLLDETRTCIQTMEQNPVDSRAWAVFALARNGVHLDNVYMQKYYTHMLKSLAGNQGKLADTAGTADYAALILTMTAMGKDARSIAGYNLIASMAADEAITTGGASEAAWTLTVLNSSERYTYPQLTKEKLVDTILDKEKAQGGWAADGYVEPDPETTALALQALAPLYQKAGYEKVTAAIDRALTVLSAQQRADGGYTAAGEETAEAASRVLTALCSLGIDPATDQRFIKNGSWIVENLLSYRIAGGGFMHTRAGYGTADQSATEKVYCALTAYQRLLKGESSLYNMSDMQLTKADSIEENQPTQDDTKKDDTKDGGQKDNQPSQDTKDDTKDNNSQKEKKNTGLTIKKDQTTTKKKLTIKTGKKLKLASGSGKKLTVSGSSGKKLTVSGDTTAKKLTLTADSTSTKKLTLADGTSSEEDGTESSAEELTLDTDTADTADTAEDTGDSELSAADETSSEAAESADTVSETEEMVDTTEDTQVSLLDANEADNVPASVEEEKKPAKGLYAGIFAVCMLIAAGISGWYLKKKNKRNKGMK